VHDVISEADADQISYRHGRGLFSGSPLARQRVNDLLTGPAPPRCTELGKVWVKQRRDLVGHPADRRVQQPEFAGDRGLHTLVYATSGHVPNGTR
jgi:hypothetical protein